MKKLIMAVPLFASLFCAVPGRADNGKHHEVVTWQAEQSFARHFGAQFPVAWTARGEFDEAHFARKGQAYTAYYTPEGHWLGTLHTIKYSQLPQNARHYINKHYGSSAVLKVKEYLDNSPDDDAGLLAMEGTGSHDHYFVLVQNNRRPDRLLLKVDKDGEVGYFSRLANDVVID